MRMRVVAEPARRVPVREEADVIVCGGGPSGIAAALSAARAGAKTLLVERYGFLGGMGTVGMVSTFAPGYHDKKRFIIGGIFAEIRTRLQARDAIILTNRKGWEPFHPEVYKHLVFELLQEAGVKVLCHTLVVDAVTEGDRIAALLVESKAGRQALIGRVYVDATGDGDVAARAGVPFEIGRVPDQAVQPMTLMYLLGNVDVARVAEALRKTERRGVWETDDGRVYLNATGFQDEVQQARVDGCLPTINRDHVSSIFTIPWLPGVVGVNFGRVTGLDPLDPEALTMAEWAGRQQVLEGLAFLRKYVPGFENAQLVATAPQIGVRESRRIKGDYILTQDDILAQRQFDDVIAQSCYMIDIHLPDSDKTTIVKLPPGTHYDIPYRSLVPVNIDNLLLAGRCISATHEAQGSLRVQAVSMAIGEAAGAAAALSVRQGCSPRRLATALLQSQLEEQGAILT